MKPRTLWACHPVAAMMPLRVAPPGRFSSSSIWAVLLPSRALAGFSAAVARFPALAFIGATAGACGAVSAPFLALVAFLVDLALAAATGDFRFVALAFAVGFGSGAVPAAGRVFSSIVDVVMLV